MNIIFNWIYCSEHVKKHGGFYYLGGRVNTAYIFKDATFVSASQYCLEIVIAPLLYSVDNKIRYACLDVGTNILVDCARTMYEYIII